MSQGRFSRPSAQEPKSDKPTLEKVLDHYAVDYYTGRTRQMIRCPIHGDERTPSCSIDLDKQVFNCHSCGAGGDAWGLIMQKEGVTFDGARRIATAERLTDGSAGGSGSELRGRFDRRGSQVPGGSGAQSRDGGYTPTWRRK